MKINSLKIKSNKKIADIYNRDTLPFSRSNSFEEQNIEDPFENENLHSFIQTEMSEIQLLSDKALNSLKDMPASQERLRSIIDFFNNEVLEKSLDDSYREYSKSSIMVAQNYSSNKLNDLPDEVLSLAQRMYYICKSLKYNPQKVSDVFYVLLKTYNQESNYSNKGKSSIMPISINIKDLKRIAAKYKGKEVELNKPTKGDVKKFKVFVKNDKGNVVKVNFGDPNMEIKRDDPERKKNFRARHKCNEKKDKTTPAYWSCKMWSNKPVSEIVSSNNSIKKKAASISKEPIVIVFDPKKYDPNDLTEKIKQAIEDSMSIKVKSTTNDHYLGYRCIVRQSRKIIIELPDNYTEEELINDHLPEYVDALVIDNISDYYIESEEQFKVNYKIDMNNKKCMVTFDSVIIENEEYDELKFHPYDTPEEYSFKEKTSMYKNIKNVKKAYDSSMDHFLESNSMIDKIVKKLYDGEISMNEARRSVGKIYKIKDSKEVQKMINDHYQLLIRKMDREQKKERPLF